MPSSSCTQGCFDDTQICISGLKSAGSSSVADVTPTMPLMRYDSRNDASANANRNPLRPPSAVDSIFDAPQATPALTMSEFCTELHLRRIEGRGNMARMHGYTADIHQFPTPPPLTGRERRAVERKCLRWLRRVKAHQPAGASV